jgi:hypothetical protein
MEEDQRNFMCVASDTGMSHQEGQKADQVAASPVGNGARY